MAADRRGRGDTPDGHGPYAIEDEVAGRAGPAARARPRPILFGHSYGALVAAAAAPRAEGLARLVLYEPPMGGVLATDDWLERLPRRWMAAGDRERAVTDFLEDIGRLLGG